MGSTEIVFRFFHDRAPRVSKFFAKILYYDAPDSSGSISNPESHKSTTKPNSMPRHELDKDVQ